MRRTARHDPNDARHAEILEQLHQLFRDQDYALVDDMAKALFPAVDTVKRCHAHAKEEIDETFARGMTEFNDACKSVEAVTVEDLKLLRKSYDETKVRFHYIAIACPLNMVAGPTSFAIRPARRGVCQT